MLAKVLPFFLVITGASAQPLQLGPLTVSATVYGASLDPKIEARVAVDTSVSTVRGSALVSASIARARLEQALGAALKVQLADLKAGPCSFHLQRIETLTVHVRAATALIDARLALSPDCALAPDTIDLHLAIAPQIQKGGVAALNVGEVRVHLPGAWSLADGLVAGRLEAALKARLKQATYALPAGEDGKFALRSVVIDDGGEALLTFRISLDSLHTRDQLNHLLARQLSGFAIAYP